MTAPPINLAQLRATMLMWIEDKKTTMPGREYCETVLALIDTVEAARPAIAESAAIIETLRAQDDLKPYREFSPKFRATLAPTCERLRTAARHYAKFTTDQPT